MIKYVALLRGINVSGQKKIIMSEFRELLLKLGFENVQTYIQSGNIVFESDQKNQKEISETISSAIYKTYNFEVPVIVKSVKEWNLIVNNNPFSKKENCEPKSLYVTFLWELPTSENIETLKSIDFSPDKYEIRNTIIYSVYPNGMGRSKMTNTIFEKKLRVVATTRNWNTLNKMLLL